MKTGSASTIDGHLQARIDARLQGAAPGLRLQAYLRGEKVCDLAAGDTYAYYDLASLTKIIFTTQAMMAAFDEGLWTPDTLLRALWPACPHPGCRVTDLLTHTSGALWWHPFYKEVDASLPPEARRGSVRAILPTLPWEAPGGKCVYSDVGFIVLGFVLEAMYRRGLAEIWRAVQERYLPPADEFAFHEGNVAPHAAHLYAPTEACASRGRLLQGEVHDENAWSFGGLSTHAGLFGTIEDVARYGLALRATLGGGVVSGIRPETVAMFTRREIPAELGDRALGFRLPPREAPSCGQRFSDRSFGHEGFTGTSLWFDPTRDLLVVLLSNRVLLGRDNPAFRKLRPDIHDWVVEACEG